jgi:hypothetical protein
MKILLCLTLILFYTSVFTSCSSDEGTVASLREASIVGTWNLSALETTNGRSDTNFDTTYIPTTFTELGKDFATIVTFSEGPNRVTTNGIYTTVLTTTIMGETTIEEQEGEPFFECDEWRLENGMLYLRTGVKEVEITITKFTDSKITLSYTVDETVDLFGAQTRVSATYNMTLSK